MDKIDSHEIIQVCIIVKDIEKTARNYAQLFGVELPPIKLIPPAEIAHTTFKGKATNTRAKICSFRMGAISLELNQPDDEPSVWKEFLDTRGEGVCYLGLWVDDAVETIQFLGDHAIPLVHRGEYPGGNYNCVDSTEKLGVILNIKQNDH